MSFDLLAEVEHAKYLDFFENNKDKVMAWLLLEKEELMRDIYEHAEEWGVLG